MKRRLLLVALVLAASLPVGCKNKGEKAATEPAPSVVDPKHPADGKRPDAGKPTVPVASARGPEHAVFSLADNRLLAHVQRQGGLVVPAGSAGFAKYLRFGRSFPGWAIRDHQGDVAVARMKSKAAGVIVPLGAAQASGATIRLRAFSAGPQRLGIRLNGSKEVTADLADGWTTAAYAVPEGGLVAGENELLFFAGKSPVALAWLEVGGKPFGDVVGPSYDGTSHALVLPDGGGAAYYVMVPTGGLVAGDLDDAGCKVAVQATPEQGAPVVGELHGQGSAVSLATLAGKVVRLELTAAGCPVAHLAGAALVVPGAAPEWKRGAAPRHVVLLVMDSLRADRIRAINPDARPETPFFDEMVGKGAVFTQMYVEGNESKCSHASIWTSTYPAVHKMIPPNEHIGLEYVTVEEVAKDAGMYADGVSGNGYITPKRGFGDKWDRFKNHIHDGGGLKAEDIFADGLTSLAGKEKDPWFLYLGTIDTHVSWRAKQPWFGQYDTAPYDGRFKQEASGEDMGKVAAGALKLTDRDKTRVIALYDSNVSYQADQAKQLFAKLEEWGVLGETMVIMTADHGDEQFEAGRVGHGGSSLETLVHVPLMIYYPPMVPAGRVLEGAESVDIVPTIADALGVKFDPAWQGESLLPLVNGVGRGYPRMSMSSKYENGHAGRMGTWKIYYSGGGKPQLFDLATEPTEKTNVADQHPAVTRMLGDAMWMLRTYNVEWRKSRWGNPANQRAEIATDLGD